MKYKIMRCVLYIINLIFHLLSLCEDTALKMLVDRSPMHLRHPKNIPGRSLKFHLYTFLEHKSSIKNEVHSIQMSHIFYRSIKVQIIDHILFPFKINQYR